MQVVYVYIMNIMIGRLPFITFLFPYPLGANGAGKTTALSMLTRLVVPTAGEAWVTGQSILHSFSKAACHLGVVTQNNSLWTKLTVEEHLYLFARLRGVPEDLVKRIVAATIDQLELTPHRHKLAQSLSGGMKRKLCVAIALIGDPDVVLLDEPSAGLDPVSRRNLWSVILRTMSHRSVVLTTHSMDEAEALCGRIGIMVGGQMRVLGSKQHLKSKFGSGFELSVKLHVVQDDLDQRVEGLTAFVLSLFPSATILSGSGGQVVYSIPREEASTAKVFTAMEMHKQDLGIEDYMLAQPTLEQVFIRTVHKHTPQTTRSGSSLAITPYKEGNLLDNGGKIATPDAVVVDMNKCGCSDRTVQVLSATNCGLFLAFWLISGLVFSNSMAGSIFFLVGVVNLIIVVVGIILLCCACCKPPKGAEE
ncbi:ATP-binding cassette domain-containing protein [archaeon]|nr:MAG: ATP-binding cassette domain-containing protein [archaeon]